MAPPKKERSKKRDLIRWDEDKDTQILLAIQAHSNKRGIKIPWDDVAQEIGPKVTGNAVLQHLAKVKKRRQDSGQPVPELGNRRKNLKRAASEDSDEAGDEAGGKSDDSYQGPTPKSVQRRLAKVVKHESGASSTGRKADQSKIKKSAGASKNPRVKIEEDDSMGNIDEKFDPDETEDGEELLAPGQPFLRFDEFEDSEDSDTQELKPKAEPKDATGPKAAPAHAKPVKVVKLRYKKPESTKQMQGGQDSQKYQLPTVQTATDHFEAGWNDGWSLPPSGTFNPVPFNQSPMARTYGFGHPPAMMSSLSFPPTYGHQGNYPSMMGQRMGYGSGDQDGPLSSPFTPINVSSSPFRSADDGRQHQSQSQPLPQLTWDNTEETTSPTNAKNHHNEEHIKTFLIGGEEGAVEERDGEFKHRSSSVASSNPNFDDLGI